MQSDTTTVGDYLAELPDQRRRDIRLVRDIITSNLPKGYVEVMAYGMIAYQVPLAIEPKTYNGQPLMYAGLAAQKNHLALYMCSLNCVPGAAEAFTKAWKATGRKLDMGKSCLRFKSADDLDLTLIGQVIAGTSVDEFVRCSAR